MTLRPLSRINAPREHDHAVADCPNRTSQSPECDDLRLQLGITEVLAHSRGVAAGQEQAVEIGRLDPPPGERIAKSGVLGQLFVEADRLGLGA